jgi:putative DNA primase/helicase
VPEAIAAETSIRAQVLSRREEEAAALAEVIPPPADADGKPELDPQFIEDCLYENERGDGVLYATLMRNRFIYVSRREKLRPWLMWRGHHWEVAEKDEHIWAVEDVALIYQQAAEDLADPIRLTNSARTEAGARATAAKDRAKALKDAKVADLAAIAAAETEGRQAEVEEKEHLANLKRLQKKKRDYTDRVSRLRSKSGMEKCVWNSYHIGEDGLVITGGEIDQQRMLLPCPNGVIDERTGQLHPGSPSDYLLRSIAVDYPEHLGWERIRHYLETGEGFMFPEWETYVDQLVEPLASGEPDREVILCLQKLLGNSFTGDVSYHKICVVWGDGRNGKGVLFRTAESILAEYFWKIKAELLLDTKNQQSTAGPSPELMALRFKRMVVASETDKHRYISEAKVKDFSGGDKINARDLFGAEENIDPTWHLWIQTNNIPLGMLKSFSMRKRLVLFHFPYMYVDDVEEESRKEPHNAKWFRPIDHDLEKKIQKGKEYILLWFLRGALLAQRDGIAIPAKLRADMEGQQILEDNLEQFLRYCTLQHWDPDLAYAKGDLVNRRDPQNPEKGLGVMYEAREATEPGDDPADAAAGKWIYKGGGIDPEGRMMFKHFYAPFKAWFEENVTDKKDKIPSPKSLGTELRKKGYRVTAEGGGGQTWIYSDIRILTG